MAQGTESASRMILVGTISTHAFPKGMELTDDGMDGFRSDERGLTAPRAGVTVRTITDGPHSRVKAIRYG